MLRMCFEPWGDEAGFSRAIGAQNKKNLSQFEDMVEPIAVGSLKRKIEFLWHCSSPVM